MRLLVVIVALGVSLTLGAYWGLSYARHNPGEARRIEHRIERMGDQVDDSLDQMGDRLGQQLDRIESRYDRTSGGEDPETLRNQPVQYQ